MKAVFFLLFSVPRESMGCGKKGDSKQKLLSPLKILKSLDVPSPTINLIFSNNQFHINNVQVNKSICTLLS